MKHGSLVLTISTGLLLCAVILFGCGGRTPRTSQIASAMPTPVYLDELKMTITPVNGWEINHRPLSSGKSPFVVYSPENEDGYVSNMGVVVKKVTPNLTLETVTSTLIKGSRRVMTNYSHPKREVN